MSPTNFRLSPSFVSATLLTAVTLVSTGCGIGPSAPSESKSSAAFHGIVHGGPNPVIGATVTLYATGTGSYGAAAAVLGTATTLSDGSFVISRNGNTCSSPQQAYIAVNGGNPGAGENANYLLMAALGDCPSVNASSIVWVDEITTVAAAYALSNFISIDTSEASPVVNIGAPATNAAATGSCTGTGSAMTCSAAGLVHAFQNALNLANSIGDASTPPNGQAYTTTPGNSQGTVPAALINALANSIEVCVNSTGGAAGSNSPCGHLFSYTTPPNLGTTPTAPTNTLQAAINMAKYPANNAASIFSLPSGYTTFYTSPLLTSAPHDLSLAIAYKGISVGGMGYAFTYPYYSVLDANDNLYAISETALNTGPVTVDAMTSNGAGLWASGTVSSSPACYLGWPCISAVDATGTLWLPVSSNVSSTSGGTLYPINTTSGNIGTGITLSSASIFGVAVDKFNTVFVSNPNTSPAISFYTVSSGSLAPVVVGGTSTNISLTALPGYITFDNSGNFWDMSKYSATNAVVNYMANSGTSSTYLAANVRQIVLTTTGGATGTGYGLVTNSANTAYANNATTLYVVPVGNTTNTSFTITDGTNSSVSARFSAIDGAGSVFLPDYNGATGSYVYQFYPPSGSYAGGFASMLPCEVASGTTSCSTTAASEALDGPFNARIDSTGSIWVTSSMNGNIVQIIGTAAPTWPLLPYGHSGVTP